MLKDCDMILIEKGMIKMKRKVIIDTDPGIDDLMALAVAFAISDLEIIALSTVHGNVSLNHTSNNARLISDLLNMHIPIIKGAAKPLFYDKKEVSPVHGKDGLANMYSEYRRKVEVKAEMLPASHLDDLIMQSDEKITLIALGPLTNIARLILAHDNLSDKVDEIHIMGGGMTFGNINELTEFNFYSDSHAAKIVLESDIPIVLSPLDLTHKIYFTEDEFKGLKDTTGMLEFIKKSVQYYIGFDPYMHDVCSVLTLTHPELFEFQTVDVDVIVGDTKADGLSYIKREDPKHHIKVATSEKREEIVSTIFKLLEDKYA